MKDFGVALYKKVIAHPYWCVALTVSICLAAASGMHRLQFNNDSRIYFDKGSERVKKYDEFRSVFSHDDAVVIGIVNESRTLYNKTDLMAIADATEKMSTVSRSLRTDSLTNFLLSYSENEALVVEELVEDPEILTSDEMESLRSKVSVLPEVNGSLISTDGSAAVVATTFKVDPNDLESLANILEDARNVVQDLEEKYPHLRFVLTGNLVVGAAFMEQAQEDLTTLSLVMFGIIGVLLFVFLRSIGMLLVSLCVIVLSVTSVFGVMGWFGIDINSTTAGIPTIIMTLAIADVVHFFTSYFHFVREGDNRTSAVERALRETALPLLMTSVTTFAGYMSMLTSSIPPFREFGLLVAMGVGCAYLLTMFLVVPLARILPFQQSFRAKPIRTDPMNWLSSFVIQRRKAICITWAVGLILSLLLIPKLVVDDSFIDYFAETTKFRQGNDLLDKHLGGINLVELSVDTGVAEGIHDPKILAELEQFENYIMSLEKVVHVQSIVSTLKRLNMNLHEDDKNHYRLPDDRDQIAQYLLLFGMALPVGRDLTDQVNIDKSKTRVRVRLQEVSTKEITEIVSALETWPGRDSKAKFAVNATGMSVLFANVYNDNIQELILGTVLALLVITGCIAVMLSSWKAGLLSMIPNLVPLFLAFGIWALVDGFVGLATATVVMTVMGLVVDDTVHFLVRYREARKSKGVNEAIQETLTSTGRALVFTTLTLCCGFGVLGFSDFKINSVFGHLCTLTIFLALAADLIFLPALLSFQGQSEAEPEVAPNLDRTIKDAS